MVTVTAFERVQRQIDQRINGREWLGMQCVVLRGEDTVMEVAAGESSPGVPMTVDDRLRWTCSSKVATAVLFARLEDEGLVDVDEPLAAFAGQISCAHLFNHSAGLSDEAEEPFLSPYGFVAELARLRRGFTIGEERMYSSFANYSVLAAVAEKVAGRTFVELVDDLVLPPSSSFTGTAQTWIGDAGTFTPAVGELIPPDSVGSVFPGTSCVGPARDLAAVVRVMSPHSSRRPRSAAKYVTRRPPFVPCGRSGDTAEWGLGFVVGRARFGRWASSETFGHAGCRSSVVLHDPVHDLTIAVVSNTISKSLVRSERVKPFIPAIYEDLGLE
jgi:CubicO group peptidase (beta-lactamase class C family)